MSDDSEHRALLAEFDTRSRLLRRIHWLTQTVNAALLVLVWVTAFRNPRWQAFVLCLQLLWLLFVYWQFKKAKAL